ncbi:MAG: hypothetical protein AB9869_00910 [Verrucomicrobiia bacterium]
MKTKHRPSATTGLPGLDAVLSGIEPGDNIVWEIDAIEDYQELVAPYAAAAKTAQRRLVYFRFADHQPLLPPQPGIQRHDLNPLEGFEEFVRGVHEVIEEAGMHAIYIFDCLSFLATTWASDQSLANFFLLTCPRLFHLETVTYFGLFRDHHSSYALEPIRGTTQFMLDIFRLDGRLYVPTGKSPAPFPRRDEHPLPPRRRGVRPGQRQRRYFPHPFAYTMAAPAK